MKKVKVDRYSSLFIIACIVFSVLLIRLTYIQVVKSDEYKEKADKNSYTEIPDVAPRGIIYDKSGNTLATNHISYTLTYTETDENKKSFISTANKVLSILDSNGEKQVDDFALKTNPYRFEFNTDDAATKKWAEIRFKKDRGMGEKTVDGKKVALKDAELLAITPEQTFKFLLKFYEIEENADKPAYSIALERRYMLIKDAVWIQHFSNYKPVVIAKNLKKDTSLIFLQRLNEMSGIDVSTEPTRYYPYGDFASSILGYISKIQPWQEDKYTEQGYDVSSDYVGTQGIESVYEDRLKGSKGGRIVRINSQGRVIEELGSREPYPGQNIYLTINQDVQYAAERALDDTMKTLQKTYNKAHPYSKNATRGAAVVEDIKTGSIIALASRPGYDPNLLSTPGALTSELRKKYFDPDYEQFGKDYISKNGLSTTVDALFPVQKDSSGNVTGRKDLYDIYPKPFFNYAIASLIPPGSTFKPVTALAGLEEGVITTSTTVVDKGAFTKYNVPNGLMCWKYREYHSTHGSVNVTRALEVSCNYFFYQVGDWLQSKGSSGMNTLAKYAWKLGLGCKPGEKATTGIELYDEESFGQVYNYETGKSIFSVVFTQELNSLLQKGRDRQNNKFKAIDIIPRSDDSEDVKTLKNNFQKLISNQMKVTKMTAEETNKFFQNVKAKLKEMIADSPKLTKLKYSDSDIENITEAIFYSVRDARAEISTPVNVLNAAIGQGTNQFTPLQLASYLSTLLNGGTRYKAHIVDKITDSTGKVIEQTKPEVIEKSNFKQSTIDAIKEGMLLVTSGEEGTVNKSIFAGFPIQTAGKTGSATFSDKQSDYGRDAYAVYLGFAPYDNPEIAVSVVIFDGGSGGYSAPVARAIFEAYFKERLQKENPNYVPKFNYTLKTK
ncbi:MAG: penicillin-binding protein [Bacillota bacterium]|nr:penicillin-binding protein [Bacillota bacterium]